MATIIHIVKNMNSINATNDFLWNVLIGSRLGGPNAGKSNIMQSRKKNRIVAGAMCQIDPIRLQQFKLFPVTVCCTSRIFVG